MLHANRIIDVGEPVHARETAGVDAPGQGFEAVAGFVRFGAEGFVGVAPGGDVGEVVDWGFAEEVACCGFCFGQEGLAQVV